MYYKVNSVSLDFRMKKYIRFSSSLPSDGTLDFISRETLHKQNTTDNRNILCHSHPPYNTGQKEREREQFFPQSSLL